jgi:hypothetical protein
MYKLIDSIKYLLFLFGLSFLGSSLVFTSELLDLVLEVLLGLSVGYDLWFLNDALLDESVLWLKLSERVFGSIDESEGSGFVSTEFSSQTKDDYLVQGSIELLGDLLL